MVAHRSNVEVLVGGVLFDAQTPIVNFIAGAGVTVTGAVVPPDTVSVTIASTGAVIQTFIITSAVAADANSAFTSVCTALAGDAEAMVTFTGIAVYPSAPLPSVWHTYKSGGAPSDTNCRVVELAVPGTIPNF